MQILSATGGLASTNAFLVIDDATNDCVLFDAPDHTVDPLLDAVEERGLNLVGLWLTHGHFDHLAAHAEVAERFPGRELRIAADGVVKLREPGSKLFPLPFTIPPGEPTHTIADGDELQIGNLKVVAISTPGHCRGHLSFHLPDEHVLIGGDLILMHAVGRTDLPDSSEAELMDSLRRVMTLPDETTLLPGHGEPSTLGLERQVNPYVRHALGL